VVASAIYSTCRHAHVKMPEVLCFVVAIIVVFSCNQ